MIINNKKLQLSARQVSVHYFKGYKTLLCDNEEAGTPKPGHKKSPIKELFDRY